MARKITSKLILQDMIKTQNMDKIKVKCKNCGHSMHIPYWLEKQLCDYCGFYQFREKKDEFTYRLKEEIYRKERNENEKQI